MREQISESILERIQKIKALTTSSESGEAAAAAAMLAKMLQQYNLDISEIKESTSKDTILEESRFIERGAKSWQYRIAKAVAYSTFCRMIISHKYDSDRNLKDTVVFIGFKKDSEVAAYIFEQLVRKVRALSSTRTSEHMQSFRDRGIKDVRHLSGEDTPMAFKMSWINGAVASITQSLYATITDLEKSSTGKELVTTKRTSIAVYVKKEYPALTRAGISRGSLSNSSAYQQGVIDGKRIRSDPGLKQGSSNLRLTGG